MPATNVYQRLQRFKKNVTNNYQSPDLKTRTANKQRAIHKKKIV